MTIKKIKVILLVSFFVLSVSCIAVWKICFNSSLFSGTIKHSDPRHKNYTYAELNKILYCGMTKQEVIKKFGKPFYDSQDYFAYMVDINIIASHKNDAEYIGGFSIIFDKEEKVAQWDVAYAYNVAKPNPKIDKEAFERYKKSATGGDPKAQCNLGMCYFNGEYVAKDDKEAAKWFAKAAAQGDARADAMLDSLNLRKWIEDRPAQK